MAQVADKLLFGSGSFIGTSSVPESRHKECPLCLERFESPRILPCFHTFCLQCLSRLIETQSSRGSFPCPTCRTRVKIPAGGAAKFQVNFYIENDSPGRQQASEGACVCGECRDAPSTHVCDDCSQRMCDLCTNLHVNAVDSECRTASKMQGPPQDPASDQRSCAQHPQEKYRFFCQRCRVPLCRDCKLTSHEGHNTCDLRQVAARAKDFALDVQRAVEDLLLPQLTQQLEQARRHREDLPRWKGDILATLTRRAEVIKDAVDACLYETVLALISQNSRAEDLVEQTMGDMEHQLACCRSLCDHVQHVAEKGSDADMLDMTSELVAFFGQPAGQARSPSTTGDYRLNAFTRGGWRLAVRWSDSTPGAAGVSSETSPCLQQSFTLPAALTDALTSLFGSVHTDTMSLLEDARDDLEHASMMTLSTVITKRRRGGSIASSHVDDVVRNIQNRIGAWLKLSQ